VGYIADMSHSRAPMAVSLPVYSPSSPSPTYSATPGSNERILQHTPLPGHPRSTGTFVRTEHTITVLLDGLDEDNCKCRPSFGRGASLRGNVLLESDEIITAVSVKVRFLHYIRPWLNRNSSKASLNRSVSRRALKHSMSWINPRAYMPRMAPRSAAPALSHSCIGSRRHLQRTEVIIRSRHPTTSRFRVALSSSVHIL
jgi:hypothetical protein